AVNDQQFDRVANKVRDAVGGNLDGKRVAVWGLAFKAGTDDLRDSPAVAVCERLRAAGATLTVYDPTVDRPRIGVPADVHIVADPLDACRDADALIVLTEWDQFKWIEPTAVGQLMRCKVVVDGRNLLDRISWQRAGFTHRGIGR
ncbi:MAG: UDP binding domain-containing protein, partial [Actinomycetota bacterium]